MGYSAEQIADLEQTINASDCDLVLFATPIQLTRIVSINKPAIRVRYEYENYGEPTLEDVLLLELKSLGLI
jgi:predicted GTPase